MLIESCSLRIDRPVLWDVMLAVMGGLRFQIMTSRPRRNHLYHQQRNAGEALFFQAISLLRRDDENVWLVIQAWTQPNHRWPVEDCAKLPPANESLQQKT